MVAIASQQALCALEFSGRKRTRRLSARLERWFAPYEIEDRTSPLVEIVREWLADYFDGTNGNVDAIPLDMRGAPFELRVWSALRRIRPGTTTTYGEIARQLGSPGAARAVGMANGANPIAILVPCHRVIGADGRLTGYGGGLDRKAWLLNHEARFFELR